MVIAGCQNTFPNGHRDVLEFGPIELFDGSIESIAVNVHDILREISCQLQLGNIIIGATQVRSKINAFELSLPSEDALNFLGQVFVFDLLVVEEFGAFGGIVDDFRDLPGRSISTTAKTRHTSRTHFLLVNSVLACLGQRGSQKVILESVVFISLLILIILIAFWAVDGHVIRDASEMRMCDMESFAVHSVEVRRRVKLR